MDGSHFDALTRALSTAGSRRRALGGLLAGALGVLRWPEQEETQAHNALEACKKKSGKAKKKCVKKARKHNATHVVPTSPPAVVCTPSCAACEVCVNGACQAASDDTACNSNGRCLKGICNPRPTCAGAGADCGTNKSECCSGGCVTTASSFDSCVAGTIGSPCRDTVDCVSHICVGYRCAQGTRPDGDSCTIADGFEGDDQCASGQCGCNLVFGGCTCRHSTCGGSGASCFRDLVTGDDGSLDCCKGRCVESSQTHQFRCVDQ